MEIDGYQLIHKVEKDEDIKLHQSIIELLSRKKIFQTKHCTKVKYPAHIDYIIRDVNIQSVPLMMPYAPASIRKSDPQLYKRANRLLPNP